MRLLQPSNLIGGGEALDNQTGHGKPESLKLHKGCNGEHKGPKGVQGSENNEFKV